MRVRHKSRILNKILSLMKRKIKVRKWIKWVLSNKPNKKINRIIMKFYSPKIQVVYKFYNCKMNRKIKIGKKANDHYKFRFF